MSNLEKMVDEMIDGCTAVIDKAIAATDCPIEQNTAVSAVGISITVATLRSVTDLEAAKKIACSLIMQFANECNDVIDEIWGDRENPQ